MIDDFFHEYLLLILENIYTYNYELTIMYYNQKERISEE